MRMVLALVLVLWGAAAHADEPGMGAGIEGVIRGQVAAFLADDFEAAFGFAAPGIREVFGSSERFGAMVRRGYPMVHRPDELRLLERRDTGDAVWQKVLIRDREGALHVLDYEMIPTGDGWRIGAVHLLKQGDAAA